MTEFQNKSFSVYPGAVGTQQYRDNYDRIFGKKKDEPVEEPVPDTIPELKSPAEDVYCPTPTEWPCRLHCGQPTPGEWCSHHSCRPEPQLVGSDSFSPSDP